MPEFLVKITLVIAMLGIINKHYERPVTYVLRLPRGISAQADARAPWHLKL
jgi:hypothetical protein